MRRRDIAVAGQAPAQQRLGADHAPGAQIDFRLIENHQLIALQRAPQLALEHQALDRRGIHAGYIERARIAAVLFRVIHGRIGVADQIDHILGIVGTNRDAGAGGEVNLLLVDVEGAADFIEQRAGQGGQGGAVVGVHRQIIDEHGELIAREPADHGVLAQISRQPLAQYLQGSIAGRVAESVVDLFEAVQVQVQKRQGALVAPRARDGLLQQMLKLHAIRHFRQGVVAREVADAALGALAFGDVARDVDVALKLRVLRVDGRTRHGDRNGLAAGGAQHRLARLRRGMRRVEGAAMHLIDEANQRPADQLIGGIAQQQLRGLIAAFDEPVRRGNEHRIAQTIEHGIEVVLGDGRFVQVLPHALERKLQIAEFVAAHDGERPGVVAVADSIRALDQRRDGTGEPAGEEQCAQQPQDEERHGDDGEYTADAFGLDALLAQQLRANAGQGLLHFSAAHPDLEASRARQVGAQDEWPRAGRPGLGIAAGIKDVVVRAPHLDPLDVTLVEQSGRNRGHGGVVTLLDRRGEGGAGDVA